MSSADLVNAQPAGYEDDCDLDDLSFVESEPSTAKKHEGNSGIGEGSSKDDSKRAKFAKKLSKLKTNCNSLKQTSTNQAPRVIASKEKPDNIKSLDDFKTAVMRNDLNMVKQCLEQGVPVDTRFSTSWTALMYAVNCGKPETVKLLLENGANPNYDKDSLTVLMVACSSSCRNEADILQCVTLLLEHKADVNAFDRSHLTPLHKAVAKTRVAVVKKLLEAGADMNQQDNNGYTPLMMAVKQNNEKMVKVLLDAGADCSKQTILGEKVSDLATLNGFTEIEALLTEKTRSGESNCTGGASGVQCTANTEATQQVHDLEEAPKPLQEHGPLSTSQISGLGKRPSAGSQRDSKPILSNAQKYEPMDVYNYGELEVFLLGLNLGDLIPKFHYRGVQFTDFLRMTDNDLQQLGITQFVIRKKVLDAIQDTHKMSWQTSSVNVVQYNKPITCADAVAMVTNIKKHVSFISSTIGYVTDQIKVQPKILAQAEDHFSSEELSIQSEEALTNVRHLYEELAELRNFLTEVADRPHYQPACLYRPSVNKKRKYSWLSVKTLLLGAAFLAVLYYRKDIVYSHISVVYNKYLMSVR